jgi:hypothetical protein
MVLVLIGPKGPAAWQFSSSRGVRTATCLNDGTVVTVQGQTTAALVTALQALAAHTASVAGQPTLTASVPW